LVDFVAVRLLARLGATRRTWRRATVRLIQNEATLARLPAGLEGSTRLLNHALFTEVPHVPHAERESHLVAVGALAPRKGLRLALLGLARTPEDVRLIVVGDGSERRSLERLGARLGIAHRLEFRGWVSRQEVLELLPSAAAAVFTGLREEGGVALAEAMLCGVPVIVLGHGGARTIAASCVDPGRIAVIEPSTVDATATAFAAAMTRFSRHASGARGPTLNQADARAELKKAFVEAMSRSDR
jgi:glycosyltransferase involved in cell wall biosynthesis